MSSTITHPERQVLQRLLVASEIATSLFAFALSYYLIPLYRPLIIAGPVVLPPFHQELWLLLLLLPIGIILGHRNGLYHRLTVPWRRFIRAMVQVQVLGIAAFASIIFVLRLQGETSRLLIVGYFVLYTPAALAFRGALSLWLTSQRAHTYGTTRTVVIGSAAAATQLMQGMADEKEHGYEFVGYFCPKGSATASSGDPEAPVWLGERKDFGNYIFSYPVDLVVLTAEGVDGSFKDALDAARIIGLRINILPHYNLRTLGILMNAPGVRFESRFGMPVVAVSEVSQRGDYLIVKRCMDIAISSILLLLLSPLFGMIALAIKLDSPRDPVFFPWRVVGKNKKAFVGYKFRTMVANAEQIKAELQSRNEMTGPVFKMRNDPRITRIGKYLRRYSLDELPQLYSVWKGDMSLVGPRPPNKAEADRFEFWQRRKLCVKPGITCLWQVNGRNEICDFSEWVRLDLEYIQNASLWLDCQILFKTIPAVLRGRGAY